jgi:hypothetical protein
MDITFSANGTTHKWLVESGLYQRLEYGGLVEERAFNADDLSWIALVEGATASGGAGDFLSKIRTALTTDSVYLAKVQAGTATNAEHIAQIAPLTRQIQAMIAFNVLKSG